MKTRNFEQALSRLMEALNSSDSNEFKIDVCIKRFEFTYEVCKKALEEKLKEKDIFSKNPREIIKQSGQQGFVSNMQLWDKMRDDRNDTSHEYDEEKALQIYKKIPDYAEEFQLVLNNIQNENPDT